MIIGIPKEVKNHEYRVGMVPGGVKQLVESGHTVLVESGAGLGSSIQDKAYSQVGAKILPDADAVWGDANLIVKVKEPIEVEYDRMQVGQAVFTYFHLAAVPDLADALLEKKVTAIAYETMETERGRLPLLQPMSEVAGRMSVQVGARCLEKEFGGSGILLGGVPGVERANIVIIGAGVVGTEAAKIAMGMGARVTILDVNMQRLAYLDDIFGERMQTLYSNPSTIDEMVSQADLVVGAVLIAGARAPRLVTKEMVTHMKPGSVIVDVAIDQGGCVETARPTTHHNPTYLVNEVVHYCVTNMPGAVPRTSTFALTNLTLQFANSLANDGIEAAISKSRLLATGVNTHEGHCTHEAVSQSLNLAYQPLDL